MINPRATSSRTIIAAAFALAAGAALAVPSAQAQDGTSGTPTGTYIGVGAGLNQPTNSTAQLQNSAGSTPTVLGFGTGYNFLGAVGYKWNPHLRTELEIDYRHAGVDNLGGSGATGAQKVLSFSGNVLYDFNVGGIISPYVGAGLGVARDRFSNVNTGFGSPNFDDHDANLQWQLIGGVSMPIATKTSLFVDYRYIGVADTTFNGSAGQTLADHYDRSHNVLAGLRFFL